MAVMSLIISSLVLLSSFTNTLSQSISQSLCVKGVAGQYDVINGDYTLEGSYYKQSKATGDIYLYRYQKPGHFSGGYPIDDNWYFVRHLTPLSDPWSNMNTDYVPGFCQTPTHIDSPALCHQWWNLDTVSISDGECVHTPSPTTGFSTTGHLTVDEQKLILSKHNEYRSKVASGQLSGYPKAANMHPLIWDSNLAEVAQNWANTCYSGHNSQYDAAQQYCLKVHGGNECYDHSTVTQIYGLGENIAGSWSSTGKQGAISIINSGIEGWFNEYPSGIYALNHFTQLVSDVSTKIGCGYNYCSSGDNLVCNYYKAGNMRNTPAYTSTSGSAGNQCPNGVNSSTGLCN